jgi:hypothetical protein
MPDALNPPPRVQVRKISLKPFDCIVIAVGVLGTLSALGVVAISIPLIVILGFASTFLCCSSVILLVLHAYVPRLERREYRLQVLYAFSNLVPTIYFLTHLKETPWELFGG